MKAWHLLPLAAIVGLTVLLGFGLSLDPREVPSPLIGQPMPAFSLPTLEDKPVVLTQKNLMGRPLLVNVWASWCAACLVEHPFLLDLKRSGVEIIGLNYKDDAADARKWLAQHGDPYRLIVQDRAGQAGLDWGVYGAPETFVIDSRGLIVHKQIGPMTAEAWRSIATLLK